MTTPTEAPREALPESLKVVAWLTSWPKDRVRPAGSIVNRLEPQQKFECNKYDPLVRLTDAQSALESERQAHAAEIAGLRVDAEHFQRLFKATKLGHEQMFAQCQTLSALLRRSLVQLGQWQRKYGEHNPSWLPPAGDVELAEDIDQAIAKGKT